MRAVISQGMRPTLVGIAIGLVGALILSRWMTSILFGMPPTDPLTFLAVALLLVAVGLAACFFPARTATRIDASVALRQQ